MKGMMCLVASLFLTVACLGQGRFTMTAAVYYYQPPGIPGAATLSDGVSRTHADNFSLSANTTIQSLAWWSPGFTTTPAVPFSIQVQSDLGGQPGSVLASLSVAITATTLAPQALLYSVALPEPLELQGNTQYWLTIVAPGNDRWLWSLGNGGDGFSGSNPGGTGWRTSNFDMAFANNYLPDQVPESGPVFLMALGLVAATLVRAGSKRLIRHQAWSSKRPSQTREVS